MPSEVVTRSRPFTVASLFAGIGGFCQAFKNADFEIKWANELDNFAATTYKENFPEVKLFKKSITDLSVAGDKLESTDILTAGFPCQSFSVAGTKKGFNDPRGKLFFEIVRLLNEFGDERPKIIVLENVKNLLNHNNGKTFSRILNEIQAAGYWFKEENAAVLNTCEHTTIPQNRERLFMVAFSWECFDLNNFTFPQKDQDRKILDLFLDTDKKAEDQYYFDPSQKYGEKFVAAMENGDKKSVYQLRRYYVRELKDYLVPTLTANMGGGGHNKPVIKDKWGIRNLTPEECLRLQGFPKKYLFTETMSQTQGYKQVGNAVTVPLVEKIARECKKQLELLNGGSI